MNEKTTEKEPEIQNDTSQENAAHSDAAIQFLTFTLGEEEYGIDIMKVREIRGWSDTTRLPNSPKYMRGVINLRGVVIPIFDLRSRFSMGETEANEKNVVIVMMVGDRTIGILVDAVSDILNVTEEDIRPAPHMETGIDDDFVGGLISVQERMVVVLEVDHMFDKQLLDKAEKAISA